MNLKKNSGNPFPVSEPRFLAEAGMTAALYAVLSIVSGLFGLASGAIQIRISEALCILPCFTVSAVPGLFIGCLVCGIVSGAALWDVVFGSLATLIGAVGTRLLRKRRILSSLPPIVANTLMIPPLLKYVYGIDAGDAFLTLSVFAGEFISAGILGQVLYSALAKRKKK